MARVLVFTPDLLFGSSLLGALSAGGHEAVMCPSEEALLAESRGCELLIVDLTDEAEARVGIVAEARESGSLAGVPVLGYHSHVDTDSREAALASGVERVVPRSRMHREPVELAESML